MTDTDNKALARVANTNILARRKARTRKIVQPAGLSLLTLTKGGHWGLGKEKSRVSGQIVRVDPTSFQEGFICFGDGNKCHERTAPIGTEIDETTLPEVFKTLENGQKVEVEWQAFGFFEGTILTGECAGMKFKCGSSSRGFNQMFEALLDLSNKQMEENPEGPQYIDVHLGQTFYAHKTFGFIRAPKATAIQFADRNSEPPTTEQIIETVFDISPTAVTEYVKAGGEADDAEEYIRNIFKGSLTKKDFEAYDQIEVASVQIEAPEEDIIEAELQTTPRKSSRRRRSAE